MPVGPHGTAWRRARLVHDWSNCYRRTIEREEDPWGQCGLGRLVRAVRQRGQELACLPEAIGPPIYHWIFGSHGHRVAPLVLQLNWGDLNLRSNRCEECPTGPILSLKGGPLLECSAAARARDVGRTEGNH